MKLKKIVALGALVLALGATSVTSFAATTNDALATYKAERLELKKSNLDAQVAAGTITRERADAIIKAIEENQLTCDGTGSARIGQNMGAKFGSNGTGLGTGGGNCSMGAGQGQGNGRGMGLRDGSCYTVN